LRNFTKKNSFFKNKNVGFFKFFNFDTFFKFKLQMFCRRKGSGENISKRTIAPFSSISFMGAIITIAIGSIKSYFFEYIKSSMLAWVGRLLPYSCEVAAITPVTSPEQHFHFQVLTHLTTTRVVAECLQLSMRKLVRILTDRMLFLMPNPPFGLVHYLLMGRQ